MRCTRARGLAAAIVVVLCQLLRTVLSDLITSRTRGGTLALAGAGGPLRSGKRCSTRAGEVPFRPDGGLFFRLKCCGCVEIGIHVVSAGCDSATFFLVIIGHVSAV